MIACFYDIETTGLPLYREPSEDPRQPHIMQLAACLVDTDTREVLQSVDLIARPDGWTIPAEVSAIHGITTEKALDEGIPEAALLLQFLGLYSWHTRIAHSEAFDARIIRIALKRYDYNEQFTDEWKAAPAQCTQGLSTKILNATRAKAKTASLAEAYKHFTGNDLVGGHRAMNDVQACIAVWFGIKAYTERLAAAIA